MTLGSKDTAQMLATHFDKGSWNKPAPKGFKKLGSGAFRTAYLDRSTNLVYKIGVNESNLDEARNARSFRKKSTKSLGLNLYIPKTRTYPVKTVSREYERVAVQEYCDGGRSTNCELFWRYQWAKCTCRRGDKCFTPVLDKIKDWSGLIDIHGSNVLYVAKTDTFWIVDIAD